MSNGPPYTHVHDPEWPPMEWRYNEGWPVEARESYGMPVLEWTPFTFSYLTPGELWRDAVEEALAFLASRGVTGGGLASEWTCFRCAVPLASATSVPAWQAGRLLEVFAV